MRDLHVRAVGEISHDVGNLCLYAHLAFLLHELDETMTLGWNKLGWVYIPIAVISPSWVV